MVEADHDAKVLLNAQRQAFLERLSQVLIPYLISLRHPLNFVQTEQPWNLSRNDQAVDHLDELILAEVVVLQEEHGSLVVIHYLFDYSLHLLLELSGSELAQRRKAQNLYFQDQSSQLQARLPADT